MERDSEKVCAMSAGQLAIFCKVWIIETSLADLDGPITLRRFGEQRDPVTASGAAPETPRSSLGAAVGRSDRRSRGHLPAPGSACGTPW